MLRRLLTCFSVLFAVLLSGPAVRATQENLQRHAIAMYGEPALPADFPHLPYANPDAPKGGRLALAIQGTFDSLNPLIVLGVAPDAVPRYVLQSLMTRSLDEPFTVYGLVATSAELPDDRSSVTFNLDPRARFSDGRPLTAEDVRFTFELLKEHGKPFHRSSFALVRSVEISDPYRIRFDLGGANDRELPLILATMPIFPAHATDREQFARTSLTPPVGSGPYRVAQVKPGERIVLTRRKDYWGEDLPITRGLYNFETVQYDFYRDANTLFEAFKAGLYDYRIEGDPGRWTTGYDIPAVRDGRIVRETIPSRTPKGMNGFVFNTRRAPFDDIRVREALGALFDFDWVNRNLFFGLLNRSTGYFAGSDLSSFGRPANARERELLSSFPNAVRDDILEGRYAPPASDGSGRDRENAKQALALLKSAGWVLDHETLRRQATGEPMSFEILVSSRPQERLALNYAQSLERIGVKAQIRLVDDVQYWRRLANFDFDMIQWVWPASTSPGNEQRNRWSAAAAGRSGSLNYAGANSPALDAMIDALLASHSRDDFVAAVRALDRVLLSGFYVVPLFYIADQWIAHDAGLRRPQTVPLQGTSVELWWRGAHGAMMSGNDSNSAPFAGAPMPALARAATTDEFPGGTVEGADGPRLSDLLAATADRHPHRLAFADQPDREGWSGRPRITWTYTNAQRIVERLATVLSRLGLPTGAPVGICLPNGSEAFVTLLAVERAGLIPCLLPIGWAEEELGAALESAHVAAVICQGRVAEERPAEMFCRLAARYFGIRFVCGFGPQVPDGVIDLDRAILDTTAERREASAGHAGVVTFDRRQGAVRPVFRPFESCIAAAMAFLVARKINAGDRILSLLAPDDHRGLTTGLVAALVSGATLEGHGLVHSASLHAALSQPQASHLVVPSFMEPALARAGLPDSIISVVTVHAAPVRFKPRGELRHSATDVLAFGEAALLYKSRSGTGHLALSLDETSEADSDFLHVRRDEDGAIHFAGAAAEVYDFIRGVPRIPAQKPVWHPSGFRVDLFAGTVIGVL